MDQLKFKDMSDKDFAKYFQTVVEETLNPLFNEAKRRRLEAELKENSDGGWNSQIAYPYGKYKITIKKNILE